MAITYSDAHEVDLAELAHLRAVVGFPPLPLATLSGHLSGSRWVVSAWDGQRLVGFLRAISDGVTNAYVGSVMVHPHYRRHAIGRSMMNRLVDGRDDIRWVLHAREEAIPFFEALGFVGASNMMRRDRRTSGPVEEKDDRLATRPPSEITVRKLSSADAASLVFDLAEILLDAVDSGASVGFMAGVSRADAEAFWLQVVGLVEREALLLFGAFDGARLVGTAQLVFARAPNQRHRAEVAKMLVHRHARRRGVGRALLSMLEAEARSLGRSVLTLDTLSDSDGEKLYTSQGYAVAGSIPDYALRPDGTSAATTLFYKRLE